MYLIKISIFVLMYYVLKILKLNNYFSRSTQMTASKLITTELAKMEKLNGVNYEMWHWKIKYALIYDNLEYVIESNPPELDNNVSEAEVKKQEKWQIDDKRAMSLTFMFMEDSIVNFFETYDTTHELQNALKEKYDKTIEINTQLLLRSTTLAKYKRDRVSWNM